MSITTITDTARVIYRETYQDKLDASNASEATRQFVKLLEAQLAAKAEPLMDFKNKSSTMAALASTNAPEALLERLWTLVTDDTPLPPAAITIGQVLDNEQSLTDSDTETSNWITAFCGVQALVLVNTPKKQQKAMSEHMTTCYPGVSETILTLARAEIHAARKKE